MTTIEDKVKLFTKIIYEKIDEKNSQVFSVFEKEKKLKMEELSGYIESERARVLEDTEKKAKIKASELVIQERTRGQKKVLALKQECINNLIQEVKERFESYVETEEYKNYLLELFEECGKGLRLEDYIIFLTEEDINKYKGNVVDIFKRYNISVTIKQSDYNIIGGFIIQHQSGKYRIDYSFLRKIEDNKELIALKYMNS